MYEKYREKQLSHFERMYMNRLPKPSLKYELKAYCFTGRAGGLVNRLESDLCMQEEESQTMLICFPYFKHYKYSKM
jgi:hypothetical protein